MSEDRTGDAASTLEDLCRRTAELIGASGGPLKSVRVRAGDMSVEVEWPDIAAAPAAPVAAGPAAVPAAPGPAAPAGAVPGPAQEPARAPADEDDGTFRVESPLVGTFYRAPSPGARPFVEVGDEVEEGQQVAIVEAMKLMNAVTVDRPGRVVEVLVSDAEPVEYGQPLFVLAAA